jgi:pSer/pThr/pTyr-binding forkhead associated (FHA) protein
MPTGAARLEVIAGNAAGTSIVVEDELVIGRHAESPGRLADDEEISREHARITLDGRGLLAIEDLGSTNGTYVNGLRISSPQTLSAGDGIELGGTTLVVRELPQPVVLEARAATETTVGPGDQPTPASGHAQPHGAGPAPPLALRVEIDLAAGEARIMLDDASEPVRLTHIDGAWRAVPPTA